ncbi:carbohydrate ABC transporter permease [Pseudoroseomonas globiformis]|uniref:Carbohydrate ABC transporter permease n=1 Tax=Teichococcus globiformis TaxID=2307229 RepID=A0ABV7FVJ0_9PROT
MDAGPPTPQGRAAALSRRWRLTPWLFLAPALLPGAIFYLLPVLVSVLLSLAEWDALTPPRWVGWSNYAYLLGVDPLFQRTLGNTFIFAVGSAALGVPLALAIAWAMQGARLQPFWRVVHWLPMVTNAVAIAYAWRFVLDPADGILNHLLGIAGLEGPEWLGSPATAMLSVVLVAGWTSLGQNILLFSIGLGQVDSRLWDAARLDGAGPLRMFWSITLPMLRPTLLFTTITSLINGLGSFALILLLTGGGPAGSTDVTALYFYRMAFEHLRMGRASAAATVLFLLIMVLTLIQLRLLRRGGLDGW